MSYGRSWWSTDCLIGGVVNLVGACELWLINRVSVCVCELKFMMFALWMCNWAYAQRANNLRICYVGRARQCDNSAYWTDRGRECSNSYEICIFLITVTARDRETARGRTERPTVARATHQARRLPRRTAETDGATTCCRSTRKAF